MMGIIAVSASGTVMVGIIVPSDPSDRVDVPEFLVVAFSPRILALVSTQKADGAVCMVRRLAHAFGEVHVASEEAISA